MSNNDQAQIILVVDDEQSLYSRFSPEDEFSEPVKAYIKSKVADKASNRSTSLTVISREPMDEEKFRSAVSNWIMAEKVSLRINEKTTIRRLIGLLIFGSIMLLLCLSLEKIIDILQYSLMPIMGSLALSRAASILVLEIPSLRTQK